MPIVEINPMRCRMWPLHPRIDERVTEETCGTLIKSMRRHGQIVPVLGRRLRDNRDCEFELIFGARRLFAARHLDRPLRVDVREVSERDGIIAMDTENRLRRDISAYERGTSYARWLREGHFATQKDLGRALQVSAAQLSRLLNISRLPRVLVEAFSDPAELCEVWGAELSALLKDPVVERRVLEAARDIRGLYPTPSAQEIFDALRAVARRGRSPEKRVVKSGHGDELFTVSRQRGSIVLSVGLHLLSERKLKEIEAAIVDLVAVETATAVSTH